MIEEILITVENGFEDIELPKYQTELSAGMDVRAAIIGDITIMPSEVKLIPTGIKMKIPDGYEVQVRPRSGLAFKNSITVINSPGTIDADYRGTVGVLLVNHGKEDFIVSRGDRIAQLVVNKVYQLPLKIVDSLDLTERGERGFGHSGVK